MTILRAETHKLEVWAVEVEIETEMGAVNAVCYALNEDQRACSETLASISTSEYSLVLSVFIVRDVLDIVNCYSVIDQYCPKSFQTCRCCRRKSFNDVISTAMNIIQSTFLVPYRHVCRCG
jgi:hypothetical protein